MRNPYDCTVTQNKVIFCSDNASNPGGYGIPQTGCVTNNGILDYKTGTDLPHQPDEINKIIKGKYYGSPNMARCRAKKSCAQCKYVTGTQFSPGTVSPTTTLKSSTDGIVEFVSNVFNGDQKGLLFACKYK